MRYFRIVFILPVAVVLFLVSCENNLDKVTKYSKEDNTPLLVEKNATVYYTDSARSKLKLTAPLIKSYGGENSYDLFPLGMKVDFYDDSMNVSSHVSADSAIMYNNKKRKLMEADNHVDVINRKKEELKTEQLFWDETKHILYTNKAVTIQTATQLLYGDGLTSNEDFSNYKITNLRGTVMLNNQQK
jgi:LPS export ABC transporter protein LptC